MGKNFFEDKVYNKALLKSKNFRVVPSLGSLVSGWSLIVPEAFYLNFSSLDNNMFDELIEVIKATETSLYKEFGRDFVLFEHGPQSYDGKVGCGVDYAHIHLVPIKDDLLEIVKLKLGFEFNWQKVSSIKDIMVLKERKVDYLYYRNQVGEHFVTQDPNIPSQLFRKAIAVSLGVLEQYDWKLYPQLSNVFQTISFFKQN